jgi:hypothetical protein
MPIMINPDTKENIITKNEQAQECATKAWQLCEKYSRIQNRKYLKEMGGYLGTFVNNLRSALNYAMVDYCTQRGFTKNKKGKDISTDFPYARTEDKFKNIEIVSLMSKHDPNLYAFVEKVQPYHPNKRLLADIMGISNLDKHRILANVKDMNIDMMLILDKGFFQPRHFGSSVLIGTSDGKPSFVATPCYVPQIRMFALSNGKWLNFMIPLENRFVESIPSFGDTGNEAEIYLVELIPFITNAGKEVVNIINEFYSLWN